MTYLITGASGVAHAEVEGSVVQVLLAGAPALAPVLRRHVERAAHVAVQVAHLMHEER